MPKSAQAYEPEVPVEVREWIASNPEGKKMSEQMRPDYCHWTATTTVGLDTVRLTVKGVCQEPTPGFKLTLTRLNVPGSDPDTLLLVLTVVPPTGIEPQHVTPTTVEYEQTFVLPQKHPSKVTIFEAATTIPVKAA